MTQIAERSAIQSPIPRPLVPANVSGIEITRIRTSTVASAPTPIVTRLSGTDGGSSIPASRRIASRTTSVPRKKTIFPIVPVCQPITASVGPSTDAARVPAT